MPLLGLMLNRAFKSITLMGFVNMTRVDRDCAIVFNDGVYSFDPPNALSARGSGSKRRVFLL